MRRTMLKSKIHRATVTAANVDYEGSLLVDTDLLAAADILPNELIHVWDVTNGSRLITYALPGDPGSGVVQVNGGGAHHIKPGDIVIIATFTEMKTKDARKHRPIVIFADAQNRPHEKPVAEETAKAETAKTAPKPRTKKKSDPPAR
ncbi:MAG: aspartate 1-decarboxylase [Gemmataceae bacterium]|nr:aspartate 1-decarboxylase [Gemmataceae bacterium]